MPNDTESGPCLGAWSQTEPRSVGLSSSALERAAEEIGSSGERQGLVVTRHGQLVFERYWASAFHRAEPTWRNTSFSLGKSWGSTMVGRAVTMGLFGVDDLVATHLDVARSGFHPDVTIRHVLTMTTGGTLVTKPSTRPPRRIGDTTPPEPPDEYVRHDVGEKGSPEGYGTSIEPGTTFHYDGAPADHLANVVSATSGTTSHDFVRREVVGKLGCETFRYQSEGVDAAGDVRVGGSLLLSCRDAARLGQLYLQRGRWNGEQLLAEDYVAEATSSSPRNPGYGFLWWLNAAGAVPAAPRSMFFAAGALGQFCFVLPDQDMVVATMGFGRNPLSAQRAWEILEEVLPS